MNLLTRLKEQTRPYHDAVERQLGVFDRPWSVEQYHALLRRFLGYYDPLEIRITAAADWPALGFDWPRRRKTPLLERDLISAGDRPDGLAALARCTNLPAVDGRSHALGCLYVLEGATLGGQLIVRHLSQLPGLADEVTFSFFSSYGAEVSAMWREFREFLSAQAEGGNEAIVGAACETFTSMGQWLDGGRTPES